METEEPLENRCTVLFSCYHSKCAPCIYFKGEKDVCDFMQANIKCNSEVAKVNRIVIEYTRIMEELIGKTGGKK